MHLKAFMHCFFKQLSKELLHTFPLKSLQISMNVDSVYTTVSQISNAWTSQVHSVVIAILGLLRMVITVKVS